MRVKKAAVFLVCAFFAAAPHIFVRAEAAAPAVKKLAPMEAVKTLTPEIYAKNKIPHALFERLPQSPDEIVPYNGNIDLFIQGLAASGREDLLVKRAGNPLDRKTCRDAGVDGGNPLAYVLEKAAKAQIVILNEDHVQFYDREFTRLLLPSLKRLGFEYFAAEAFSPSVDERISGDVLRVSDGTYVSEPTFGRLIEAALRLKFKLVSYDDWGEHSSLSLAERLALRERIQAETIYQKILADHPGAKVVIFSGGSHAAEVPIFFAHIDSMAMILKRLSGADPLTISQIDCVSKTGRQYIAAAPDNERGFDLFIAHPRVTLVNQRPKWRLREGWSYFKIPDGLVDPRNRTLIEVRRVEDPYDAVPLDRLMLWPGEDLPLLGPKAKLRVQRFDETNASKEVIIENK